jgi:hypothetical protein
MNHLAIGAIKNELQEHQQFYQITSLSTMECYRHNIIANLLKIFLSKQDFGASEAAG